jgi:arabinogalactan oligomer/maltooligosaccharide transport system substrate-binding protein
MNTLTRLGSLAAVTILAAACSSSGATPTATVAPSGTPATSASQAASASSSGAASAAPSANLSGSLTIWDSYASGGGSEGAAMEAVLAKAKTAFPNLTVTRVVIPFSDIFTKVETAWSSGEATPDMFIAPNDHLGDEVRMNIFYGPLDDKLGAQASSFTQIAIDGSKVDGKMYEIPESMKAVSMFYNKSTIPTPPATLDDLLALAKAGKHIGIAEYAANYYNWFLYSAFGGQIVDSSGKCIADQGGVSDGFAYLKALKTAGVTFYTDGAAFQGDFKTGKTDIVIEGPWGSADFEKALGANLGIQEIPAGPKGKSLPLSAPDGWYINANTPNKDLAVQFALWEVSAAGGEQIFADQAGHLPAVKDATVTDPVSKAFAAQILDSAARPQSKQLSNYWTNFQNAMDSVLQKGTDPVAAVKTACDAMNKANGL